MELQQDSKASVFQEFSVADSRTGAEPEPDLDPLISVGAGSGTMEPWNHGIGFMSEPDLDPELYFAKWVQIRIQPGLVPDPISLQPTLLILSFPAWELFTSFWECKLHKHLESISSLHFTSITVAQDEE